MSLVWDWFMSVICCCSANMRLSVALNSLQLLLQVGKQHGYHLNVAKIKQSSFLHLSLLEGLHQACHAPRGVTWSVGVVYLDSELPIQQLLSFCLCGR